MTVPEISQAMIRAYDEYTHLTLDRRGFMEKLTQLAGSAAAAAAIVPLIAANSAKAAIVPPDDKRVSTEDVSFNPPSGSSSTTMPRWNSMCVVNTFSASRNVRPTSSDPLSTRMIA